MRLFLFFLLGTSLTISGLAQPTLSVATVRQQAIQTVLTHHTQADSTTDALFLGPEYIPHDRRLKPHPFFDTDLPQPGQISADGRVFSVPFQYDLVTDVLVVTHPAGYRVALRPERIDSFTVQNHHFRRVADRAQEGLASGFYDLLYDGPTRLLARRTKTILISASTGNGYGQFVPKTTYFLRREGRYVPIASRKALLKTLSDRRKELTAHARQHKARYRADNELAIRELTQRYDELTRPQ